MVLNESSSKPVGNRWLIAIMGTVLQLCLGTVYAWSFFQKPLMSSYGWSNTQAAWAFSLAICFLGLAAAWGGINLPKFGPTRLAVSGGILYGFGYLISAFALSQKNLPLFYLGFGIVGGIGLGLGYVTPVATAGKWFPDRKGFITGMVVMGFGFGALLMSRIIAPNLMALSGKNLVVVFMYIGFIMLVCTIPAGLFLRNPPTGFSPPGYIPSVASSAAHTAANDALTAQRCIFSKRFLLMWLIFFSNICAGIMFIGFQSPLLQDLLKITNPAMTIAALAGAGSTLIAISSIFNGIGRFLWGGLSDKIGRIQTFRLILGSQLMAFIALLFVHNPVVFEILVCFVLLCYGGGFGSMPSFVMDTFGTRLMAVVYGAILTAWSMGGIVGPQLVAYIKDHYPGQAAQYTFAVGATLLVFGIIVSFFLNNKKFAQGC